MPTKISIPEYYAPIFKEIAKNSVHAIEELSGKRIRGNTLLNLFARAAGHAGYSAMLIDGKQYRGLEPDWEGLCIDMQAFIADELNISPSDSLLPALFQATPTLTSHFLAEKFEHPKNKAATVYLPRVALQSAGSTHGVQCSFNGCGSTKELTAINHLEVRHSFCKEHADMHIVDIFGENDGTRFRSIGNCANSKCSNKGELSSLRGWPEEGYCDSCIINVDIKPEVIDEIYKLEDRVYQELSDYFPEYGV